MELDKKEEEKGKSFYNARGINMNKLFMGFDTMRAWQMIEKDFPKPNAAAILNSVDVMEQVKLKKAQLSKQVHPND